MQYYVGKWSCVATPKGASPLKYTVFNRIDSGILREWATVPAQGEMKTPSSFTMAMSYDAQKRRYIQTQMHFDGTWSVSVAKPWTGNTEQWTDVATDNGRLGHAEYVRVGKSLFTFTAHPHFTDAAFYFKGTCSRS